MKFNVTEVEFDFDDDYANGFKLTFDEEIELRDLALGVWEADNEDDLVEEITSASGWCIKSIDYDSIKMTKPKAWEKSEYTEYYDLMKKAKQLQENKTNGN